MTLDPSRASAVGNIDRDELTEAIYECGVEALSDDERLATAVTDVKIARQIADAILALVRPVEGVTLSAEEKATIIDALRDISDMDERMARIRPSRQQEIDERRALAARLEASA